MTDFDDFPAQECGRDMSQVDHLIENERTGPDPSDSVARNIRALPNWQYDLIGRMVNRLSRYDAAGREAVMDYVADATGMTSADAVVAVFRSSGFGDESWFTDAPLDTPPEIS